VLVESLIVRAVICDTQSNEIVLNSGMAAEVSEFVYLKKTKYTEM